MQLPLVDELHVPPEAWRRESIAFLAAQAELRDGVVVQVPNYDVE